MGKRQRAISRQSAEPFFFFRSRGWGFATKTERRLTTLVRALDGRGICRPSKQQTMEWKKKVQWQHLQESLPVLPLQAQHRTGEGKNGGRCINDKYSQDSNGKGRNLANRRNQQWNQIPH